MLVKSSSVILNEIISFILSNEDKRQKENNELEEPDNEIRFDYFENENIVLEVSHDSFAKELAKGIP